MKKIIALLLTLAMVFALCACGAQSAPAENTEASAENTEAPAEDAAAPAENAAAWEPKQPITIMNYVAAGGAMDLATRKFVEIASKYTNATFVVDNMTGASGMIAADYVLDQPADGYLIYATTVTYIYGIAAAEEDAEKYINGLTWIDNIMADPYCILVPSSSEYTLESLVEEANNGSMIWCEPNAGGAKHIAAIQMCNALGIDVQVVPYESALFSAVRALPASAIPATPRSMRSKLLRSQTTAGLKASTSPPLQSLVMIPHSTRSPCGAATPSKTALPPR